MQTDKIAAEVPLWLELAVAGLGFGGGLALKLGLQLMLRAAVGGLARGMGGHWVGGKAFGEGSDGQKLSALACSLIGGLVSVKGGLLLNDYRTWSRRRHLNRTFGRSGDLHKDINQRSNDAAAHFASQEILSRKATAHLKAGNFPGKASRLGIPREMPASSNPDKSAQAYIRHLFGGEMPMNKKPIRNCSGCWVAETPDGTEVTYRPAGTASGKTLPTTASVDVNSPEIKLMNLNGRNPELLKLKFPKIQK